MSTTIAEDRLLDLDAINIQLARMNLLDFIMYVNPRYRPNWHHRVICDYYQRWAFGDIKRMMLSVPSQHGKSEIVSRYGPSWILGKNPDARFISASYSASLAESLNKDVQRIIDTPEYKKVFPGTVIPGIGVRNKGSYVRTSNLFEVVDHRGAVYSSGVGGGISGRPMDFGSIDDAYKGRQDADSEAYSEMVWRWYSSDFLSRKSSDARILLTMTRWNQKDLIGRLLKLQEEDDRADKWTNLVFPAIAVDPIAPYDIRQLGEPLWKEHKSLKDLAAARAVSEFDWASMFQQSPVNKEFSIFNMDLMCMVEPQTVDLKKCQMYGALDVSQGGSDFAAIVTVALTPKGEWLVWDADLAYDVQSKSLQKIIQKHQQFRYKSFVIESNSLGHAKSAPGDSLFIMELKKEQAKQHVAIPYRLEWHTQNKVDRIRSLQPFFSNRTLVFRSDWAKAYPELIHQMSMVPDPSAHDDGPDCLQMAIEAIIKANRNATAINYSNIRGEQVRPGWQAPNVEGEDF